MCDMYIQVGVYVCTAGMYIHTHLLTHTHSCAHICTHIRTFYCTRFIYSLTHSSHKQTAIKVQVIIYSGAPIVQLTRQSLTLCNFNS